jgi:nucleoid-associated protein YgaU
VPASRLIVALCVTVIGFLAALPFRQPRGAVQQPPAETAPVSLPLRRPDSPLELTLAAEASPASGLAAATAETADSVVARRGPSSERLNVAPPPAMPIAFHPMADELRPTSWKPTPPAPQRPVVKPRKYVLRDGDSLERLAERFLGDKSRAEEIFGMNRHVLSRADLLPVGAEIVLPPRRLPTGSGGEG